LNSADSSEDSEFVPDDYSEDDYSDSYASESSLNDFNKDDGGKTFDPNGAGFSCKESWKNFESKILEMLNHCVEKELDYEAPLFNGSPTTKGKFAEDLTFTFDTYLYSFAFLCFFESRVPSSWFFR